MNTSTLAAGATAVAAAALLAAALRATAVQARIRMERMLLAPPGYLPARPRPGRTDAPPPRAYASGEAVRRAEAVVLAAARRRR